MVKNIDKLVERGDHVALLVKKTDRMNASSLTLRGQAERVRKEAYYRNIKLKVAISCIIIILIYMIMASICGGVTLSGCSF